MKIEYTPLPTEPEWWRFIEQHDLTLVVRELSVGRWVAHLAGVSVINSDFPTLTDPRGIGDYASAAVIDYLRKIRGKLLVIDASPNTPKREIVATFSSTFVDVEEVLVRELQLQKEQED